MQMGFSQVTNDAGLVAGKYALKLHLGAKRHDSNLQDFVFPA